jgi:uncharacterized damage-inducible protein DinB
MSVNFHSRYAVYAVVATIGLIGTAVSAQQPAPASAGTAQAALVRDVGNLSDKFVGLARVMSGKYDWRPMPGVRSVSEVFNLIVTENNMLAGLLSGAPQGRGGGMGGSTPITDPAALQEALRASYAKVSQALSGLSQSDLGAPVTLFGQNTTKQGAVWMLLMDQHEHLGQSIAYARSNTIVPPWSK